MKTSLTVKEGDFFMILGHPYNLYDRYISGPVLSKLDRLQTTWRFVDYGRTRVKPTFIKWDACSIMYNTLMDLDPAVCRGVIQLSSFNCGCDSVMMEIFRGFLKKRGIPYMNIVLDENEIQTGIDTRLEAFIDSIAWRSQGC